MQLVYFLSLVLWIAFNLKCISHHIDFILQMTFFKYGETFLAFYLELCMNLLVKNEISIHSADSAVSRVSQTVIGLHELGLFSFAIRVIVFKKYFMLDSCNKQQT